MSIRQDQFINIQGWMGKEGLNLRGYHLLTYAIIYGFSQDGVTACRCHLSYFQEWCDISERTARNIIADLIHAGYIRRNSIGIGRGALVEYRANLDIVASVRKGAIFAPINKGAKSAVKGAKNDHKGGKICRVIDNNIYIYNNISFRATREALEEKRKEIYKLFFFKNSKAPGVEVEEFMRVNSLNDWKDSKGNSIDSSIKKLLYWADGWQLKQGVGRTNEHFLAMMREMYNEAIRLGDEGANLWLNEKIACESNEVHVTLYVPVRLIEWLEAKVSAKDSRYYDLLRKFLMGRKLTYKFISE